MKILVLFKKKAGGVGSVVREIDLEFKKSGHEIRTISREDDLRIFSLTKSISPIRKIIRKLMEQEKFDIIYTQDWSLAFPLLFPYPIYKKKHFNVFYGADTKLSFFIQNIIGKIMGKQLIVCNGELKRRFPHSNLIYNRVNHNFYKPSKKIKKIKDSVGFASWKTDEYHFNEIKKTVERIGKKFIFTDNAPDEKMPDFFRQLESFISLPPKHSGFGLVYLEAMASGVPKIIGNNYGGGKMLPITKVEDYKDIGEAILNAEKKDYRKWILDNNFTWEDAVEKLEKIFEMSKKP